MIQTVAMRVRFIPIRPARVLAILCACGISSTTIAATDPSTNPEVVDLVLTVDAGQFATAESAISKALAEKDIDAQTRAVLTFQRERMRRILLDFTLDEAALKAQLRKKIPDLDDAEFARW